MRKKKEMNIVKLTIYLKKLEKTENKNKNKKTNDVRTER